MGEENRKTENGATSAAGRHATSVHGSDAAPSSIPMIAQAADGGNPISAQGREVNPVGGGIERALPWIVEGRDRFPTRPVSHQHSTEN